MSPTKGKSPVKRESTVDPFAVELEQIATRSTARLRRESAAAGQSALLMEQAMAAAAVPEDEPEPDTSSEVTLTPLPLFEPPPPNELPFQVRAPATMCGSRRASPLGLKCVLSMLSHRLKHASAESPPHWLRMHRLRRAV